MDNEYLTVQEFAEAAGVSKQTIYKQMNSRLAPYVQTIRGQRKIAAVALYEFYDVVEQPNQPEPTEKQPKTTEKVDGSTENQSNSTLDNQPKSTEKQEKTSLEKRIDELEKLLQKQIEEDRQEKEFLKDQIRQKDKTIENLTENLKMAQQLAAADKKKLLEIEQRQQEKEQNIVAEDQAEGVINPAAAAADQDQEQITKTNQDEIERPPKRSFFARIFGRWEK